MELLSLLKIVEELSIKILEHYGETLKGILINLDNNKKMVYFVLILKNTKKISLANRGIIFNYFYNKVKKLEIFKQYISLYKHLPKIYPIIIDENEIEYHNPFLLFILLKGKILFQRDNTISQKLSKINNIQILGNEFLDFGKIRKGEIREI